MIYAAMVLLRFMAEKDYRGLRYSWIHDHSSMGYAGDVWGGWQFSINRFLIRDMMIWLIWFFMMVM